jgi:hypothetical protein
MSRTGVLHGGKYDGFAQAADLKTSKRRAKRNEEKTIKAGSRNRFQVISPEKFCR